MPAKKLSTAQRRALLMSRDGNYAIGREKTIESLHTRGLTEADGFLTEEGLSVKHELIEERTRSRGKEAQTEPGDGYMW